MTTPPHILITGASTGIGRALALAYARRGSPVGLTARRAPLLDTLVAEIRAAGGTAFAAPADVADRDALLAAIADLRARLGGVDTLIANAGVSEPSGAVYQNAPGVARIMAVNVMGVVHAFEGVLPEMLARRSGHLVAVASLAAYKGLPGAAGYCASKAAVRTYCESLRIELGAHNVAVTCVCPGFVTTPMTEHETHPKPLLMSAEAAAERIIGGLKRRPAVYNFPTRMRWLMGLLRYVPDRVIRRRVPVEKPRDPQAGA